MTHRPEVLIRVNKQHTLTSCFAQGDELSDVLTDVRITWGEIARRLSELPQPDQDEIDLAIVAVIDLYCAKVKKARELGER